jgi:hypothetical protein
MILIMWRCQVWQYNKTGLFTTCSRAIHTLQASRRPYSQARDVTGIPLTKNKSNERCILMKDFSHGCNLLYFMLLTSSKSLKSSK